jgi:predicted alpha-1,6-mannanase (GH76 family)
MAWIKTYDITGNDTYLSAAKDIFEDLKTGLNGTCGGQWWDKKKSQVDTINNSLFIAVGASLANRCPDNRLYYQNYAGKQADWLLGAGLFTKNNTFHDGVKLSDCSAEGTVFTYNQGVILGGLVELYKADGQEGWLDWAGAIAKGAVTSLVDSNGIMTETGSYPTNDPTADQFKGVLARNLAILQGVRGDDAYVTILTKSADAIWSSDRDDSGRFGPDWQGPVYSTGASQQSSALDCLVAAAAVSQ